MSWSGENLTGAGIVSFSDTLKHWEARFATIKLEDRNLPAIAERRILKPKSEAARQQMDDAFRQTQQIQKEVMDVLLTSDSDPAAFRKCTRSARLSLKPWWTFRRLLQRERTALKIMLQLLVEQKDMTQAGRHRAGGGLVRRRRGRGRSVLRRDAGPLRQREKTLSAEAQTNPRNVTTD